MSPASYRPGHTGSDTIRDLGPMVALLIKHKANTKALYCEKTPFQSLFQGHASLQSSNNDKRIMSIVRVSLEHGEDVNYDIQVYNNSKWRTTCKPLHISDSGLAELLIAHGASINALDGNGKTALDLAFEDIPPPLRFNTSRESPYRRTTMSESFKLVMVLLKHGGRINKLTSNAHFYFIKKLTFGSSLGIDIFRPQPWSKQRFSVNLHLTERNDNSNHQDDFLRKFVSDRWKDSRLGNPPRLQITETPLPNSAEKVTQTTLSTEESENQPPQKKRKFWESVPVICEGPGWV